MIDIFLRSLGKWSQEKAKTIKPHKSQNPKPNDFNNAHTIAFAGIVLWTPKESKKIPPKLLKQRRNIEEDDEHPL